MKRQRIIAQCLLNSGMIESGQIDDADIAVRQHFETEFPGGNFAAWNQEVNDQLANFIVKKVGCTPDINVRELIEDFVAGKVRWN